MYSNLLDNKTILVYEKVLKTKSELIRDLNELPEFDFIKVINSYAKKEKAITEKNLKLLLWNEVTSLSLKNILITNELKEQLIKNGIKLKSFILHGSSAKGNANISVKTAEIKYFKNKQYVSSEFFATTPIVSDIDVIIIVNNTIQSKKIVALAKELATKYHCQFTINLISDKTIRKEITTSTIASPAIKRIFGLHVPMCFYGYKEFNKLQKLARRNVSIQDLVTDLDVRAAKSLGSIMSKLGLKKVRLNKSCLAIIFPILFLARVEDFNTDFPKKRLKLVVPFCKPLTKVVTLT